MTTIPPTNGPGAPDEEDPTGIRALLGSLPAPGPMPDDVSRSISAALAREQEARAAQGSGSGNVAPLARGRQGRRAGAARWQRVAVSLGAAAAVAAVAVIGVSALQDRQAPTTAVPTAQRSTGGSLEDRVVVESTGTNYTKPGLATQAAALEAGNGPTLSPQEVKRVGAMATRAGIVACMQSIGKGLLDDPDKITVDIAHYEGKPAVVVVVTKDGSSTAWVVSRKCTQGEPPLAGPTAVT